MGSGLGGFQVNNIHCMKITATQPTTIIGRTDRHGNRWLSFVLFMAMVATPLLL